MWASGDYPRSSSRRCSCRLGPELVRARGLGSGRRVLDGAAGTGNAALHAAEVAASERTAAVARGWQRAKATSPSNSRFAAIAGAPSNGWGEFHLDDPDAGYLIAVGGYAARYLLPSTDGGHT
jgi:hypothetical protein